ncbi:MAG TPA: hypothetical protein VIE15_04100, partial [Acidimicrobiales bacterium]
TTFLTGLSGPLAVLADPFYTQTVYVANTGAGTVLRILPNGLKQTVMSGLDEPAGLAQDPYGNFYVSEMGSGKVLEVPRATVAVGSGVYFPGFAPAKVIESGLSHPRGISADALGNVFVSNTDGGQVKVVASLREHQLLTHGMPDPTAAAYAPSGAVYVVDGTQGWLQEWSHGALHTVATGLADPVGVAAGGPYGWVWVDQADGKVLLVNPQNGTVRVVQSGLSAPGQLWALPSGGVLVAEKGAGQILEIAPSGKVFSVISGLQSPVGVAKDRFGDLVVALENGNIYSYPVVGSSHWLYNLKGVTAMAMDASGNSYAASSRYRLVVMHVKASGRSVVVNRDFRSLTGMTCTPQGDLFIADQKSVGLFEVVPTHVITQL